MRKRLPFGVSVILKLSTLILKRSDNNALKDFLDEFFTLLRSA